MDEKMEDAVCTRQTVVDEEKTAVRMGSGDRRVLATPALIALMENAAAACIAPFLAEGQTSVGTAIQIAHTAATPVSMRIWAKATVTGTAGRCVSFALTAWDESGPVGSGTHERVIVDAQRFQEKADAKGEQAHAEV